MRNLNELYPDTPVILVNKHRIVFNKSAEEYLGVKVGTEILFNLEYGLAVASELSINRGYKVSGVSYGKRLSVYIPESIKMLGEGVYKLQEPVTIGELDWFNLEKIEDDILDN